MSQALSQAAVDILDSELGKDVVYTPQGGSPVECRGYLAHNLELSDTYGTVVVIDTAITIPRSVGLPTNGDIAVISGETYRVDRVVHIDDYLTTSSCSHG